MNHDFAALKDGRFDVLVIGGGVYGAWTAYDAALRGLRVALVERTDWAAGTSCASSKLIHGGIRYLEHMQMGLVARSLTERRRLLSLAPHRVHPLSFLVPVYESSRVGRLRMKAGLVVYDFLAGNAASVPSHATLSRDDVLAAYNGVAEDGLIGGFTFGDCQTDDARYTLEIVDGAGRAGAVTVTGVEAVDLMKTRGAVTGAVLREVTSDETVEVGADVVVNTAGPWVGSLAPGKKPDVRLTKGVHIVLPEPGPDVAMLSLSTADERVFFVMPWYGRTLVGTTDTDFAGDPDDAVVTAADIDYLLDGARRAIPGRVWTRESVVGAFAGLRALKDERGKRPSDVSREWILEAPRPGLLVSTGGKLTSARADAAEIVDRALRMLGRGRGGKSPTATSPFPWSPDGDLEPWCRSVVDRLVATGVDPDTAGNCARRFGTRVDDIQQLTRDHPALASRVVPDLPFCKAELIHAVRAEGARTLDDILRRRVPLAILSRLDRATLDEIAGLVAPEVGWSHEDRAAAVAAMTHSYTDHVARPTSI